MQRALSLLKFPGNGRLALCVLACVAVVVLGVAYYWSDRHRASARARDAYEDTIAKHELHLVNVIDACVASEEVCRAEAEMPCADATRAEALRVIRLYRIEAKTRAAIPVTMFGSQEAHDAAMDELDKIVAMRTAAERRLDELCHGE